VPAPFGALLPLLQVQSRVHNTWRNSPYVAVNVSGLLPVDYVYGI
jgi:hypothetical protein